MYIYYYRDALLTGMYEHSDCDVTSTARYDATWFRLSPTRAHLVLIVRNKRMSFGHPSSFQASLHENVLQLACCVNNLPSIEHKK